MSLFDVERRQIRYHQLNESSFGVRHLVFRKLFSLLKSPFGHVAEKIKQWTKPASVTVPVPVGSLADLPRSRRDLIVENALLRQQLLVLRQQVKRPRLTIGDRIRLICLARFTRFWESARHLVQPDTLLRWHRDLFRHYWRWKSTSKARKPRIAQETSDLLKRMTADASENRLWGAERIRGELLKLGLKVSQRTVQIPDS